MSMIEDINEPLITGLKITDSGGAVYYLFSDRLFTLYQAKSSAFILKLVVDNIVEKNLKVGNALEISHIFHVERIRKYGKRIKIEKNEVRMPWKSFNPIVSIKQVGIGQADFKKLVA